MAVAFPCAGKRLGSPGRGGDGRAGRGGWHWRDKHRAFRAAPLAVTQPVTFLQILWATLLGALVFGEAVDGFVILGGALIVGAVSLNTWAEARRGRIPPQPEP